MPGKKNKKGGKGSSQKPAVEAPKVGNPNPTVEAAQLDDDSEVSLKPYTLRDKFVMWKKENTDLSHEESLNQWFSEQLFITEDFADDTGELAEYCVKTWMSISDWPEEKVKVWFRNLHKESKIKLKMEKIEKMVKEAVEKEAKEQEAKKLRESKKEFRYPTSYAVSPKPFKSKEESANDFQKMYMECLDRIFTRGYP